MAGWGGSARWTDLQKNEGNPHGEGEPGTPASPGKATPPRKGLKEKKAGGGLNLKARGKKIKNFP